MRRIILLAIAAFVLSTAALSVRALEYRFDRDNLDEWEPVGGSWEIKGGVLVGKTAGYQDLVLRADGAENWTDYTIEVKGRLTAGRIWGICFRYEDTLTNYRLNLYEDLDGVNNLYIYKRVVGNFSEVMKVPVGAIDMDTWYTLKLEVEGQKMKAYLDGDLKIEVEDKAAPLKQGTVALEGETNTAFEVEYFRINGEGIPSPELAVAPAGKLTLRWAELKR